MVRLIFDRTRFLKLMILLFLGGLLGLGAMKVYSGKANASQADRGVRQDENAEKEKAGKADKYLFVWAGDQGRTDPESLRRLSRGGDIPSTLHACVRHTK